MPKRQLDQAAKRRKEKLAPRSDLPLIKARIILPQSALYRVMPGVIALHNDPPWDVPPSGAPRRLRDQHEAAFRGAKIRHIQHGVSA